MTKNPVPRSFAAWLLAQILGRINLFCRPRQVTNICLCYSPIHIFINIADPSVTRQQACFFPGIYANRLIAIVEALGFRSERLSNASFMLALIGSVCRGRRFMVWAPHLGPDDLPPFVRRLIGELEPLQAVKFFDDGFGFLSRETFIYQQKYLAPGMPIYSWDFTIPLLELGMPRTVVRSFFQRAISIVKTKYSHLLYQGLAVISQQMQQSGPLPVSLVLASKLLDVDLCLRNIGLCAPSCPALYIPHYNVNKNYRQLEGALPRLPLDIPEFGLLGIALSMPCRIFFGLTSTVVILIELMLRCDVAQRVDLVLAVDEARCETLSTQLGTFKTILAYYQQLDAVRERSINIIL